MKLLQILSIGAFGFLCATSAASAQSGQNAALVRQALEAGARGECPESIMGPMLRGACLQQMPMMGQRLAAMGAITGVEFLGVQAMPTGPSVEVYRVTFAEGASMIWAANSSPDGKLAALFSTG